MSERSGIFGQSVGLLKLVGQSVILSVGQLTFIFKTPVAIMVNHRLSIVDYNTIDKFPSSLSNLFLSCCCCCCCCCFVVVVVVASGYGILKLPLKTIASSVQVSGRRLRRGWWKLPTKGQEVVKGGKAGDEFRGFHRFVPQIPHY
jgi:hypothetical protein